MKKIIAIILAVVLATVPAFAAAKETAPTGGTLVKENIVYAYTISMGKTELKNPYIDLFKTSDGRYYAMFASDGGKASKINWVTGGPVTLDGIQYSFGVDGYTAVIVPNPSSGGPGYPQENPGGWEGGKNNSWRYLKMDGTYLKNGYLFENLNNGGYDYFGSSSDSSKATAIRATSRTDGRSYTYYLGSDGYAKTGSYSDYYFNKSIAELPTCAMVTNRIVDNHYYGTSGACVKNAYIYFKSSGKLYKADSSGYLSRLNVTVAD